MAQIPLSKEKKKGNFQGSSSEKHAPRPLKLWADMDGQQEVRIEIVPMIDVIFCILVFFILAAVGFSRQQAITLNLPRATTGTAQMREMLVVSLDSQGQLFLEKQPVSQVQLYSAIQNYNTINPSGLMVLHASQDVRYSQVVEILDMLKEVGGDRVALATLAGDSQLPPQGEVPTPGVNPYLNNPVPNMGTVPPDGVPVVPPAGGGVTGLEELPPAVPLPPLPSSPPSP